MDLDVGTYKGDKRVCNKSMSNVQRVNNVRLLEDTNVLTPVFLINFADMKGIQPDIANFADVNYVHWFKMKRWYYCNVIFNGQLIELHCELDARKTWCNTIKNSTQFVDRQENKFNKNLFDQNLPLSSKKGINVYKFPTKVGDSTETSRNYVLITNGKEKSDD